MEEVDTVLDKLVEDHWDYIERLLNAHDEASDRIDIAEYHYKEAFKHGWKHCKEYYGYE